jgi:hypothetical protein
MDTPTNQPTGLIDLGHLRLEQRDGQILAWHSALREPVLIDRMQLQRWLLRQLRDMVVA